MILMCQCHFRLVGFCGELSSTLASVGLAAPEPHLYGYGYPGLYSAPSSNMALMEGKFVSKKIHPNQEAVVKMYNGVWGYDEDAPGL